jgi:hypothetical protein
MLRFSGRSLTIRTFQRKSQDAGWPEETVEMFEVHSSGWPKWSAEPVQRGC